MSHLGVREWVALGALVVAMAIAALYLRPDPAGTKQAAQETSTPAPKPSATAALTPAPAEPTATPTPVPSALPAGAVTEWTIAFYQILPDGKEVEAASGSSPRLDLEIPGAPFGEVPDGQWKVYALARLEVPAGYYEVRVGYRGAISVSIEGDELASADGEGQLKVLFATEGNPRLRIEVTDGDGPTRLRWE